MPERPFGRLPHGVPSGSAALIRIPGTGRIFAYRFREPGCRGQWRTVDNQDSSPQGERYLPGQGEQDDWWGELYAPEAPDTGRTRVADTLDDRFDSVSRTVGADTAHPLPAPRPDPPSGPGSAPGAGAGNGAPEEPGSGQRSPVRPEPSAGAGTAVVAEQDGYAAERDGRRDEPDGRGDESAASGPPPATEAQPAPAQRDLSSPPAPPPQPERGPAPGAEPVSRSETPGGPAVVGAGVRPGSGPELRAEPGGLPPADPVALGQLLPDTELDGAQYGTVTLRAAALRGDSARQRAASRQEALLTARFGDGAQALLLMVIAAPAAASAGTHEAARELSQAIGTAVGRSHARLAEDLTQGRNDALKSGLHRLTDRAYGKLHTRAEAHGVQPDAFTAELRCLLLPADPGCAARVFFGAGPGGLFRLREGTWQDLEPAPPDSGTIPEPAPDSAAGRAGAVRSAAAGGATDGPGPMPPGPTPPGFTPAAPQSRPFRFRAGSARTGDTLLMCSAGLAGLLRTDLGVAGELAARWAAPAQPPGLAAFLADLQLPHCSSDRTAVAVWDA